MGTVMNAMERLPLSEVRQVIIAAQDVVQARAEQEWSRARTEIEDMAEGLGVSPQELFRRCFPPTKLPVRFRNPENEAQTWSGAGPQPKWLREAIAAGAPIEHFAVAP